MRVLGFAISPTLITTPPQRSDMSQPIRLKPPLKDEDVERLKIGDRVLIHGVIYTGRDAAHKRLIDLLERGENPSL